MAKRAVSENFNQIAEMVQQTCRDRKDRRTSRDRVFAEIDRQVAMQPSGKQTEGEYRTSGRAYIQWMPETELPMQSVALETDTADARRMLFPEGPDAQDWFQARAYVTDDNFERMDMAGTLAGEQVQPDVQHTQADVNHICEAVISHYHRQYDYRGTWDRINADAFKYGDGLGRVRLARMETFREVEGGLARVERFVPRLVPVSIKNTYLDDTCMHAMHEGQVVQPAIIRTWMQKLDDLKLAARKGRKDPTLPDGGWIPGNISGLTPQQNGQVEVMEWEGDIVLSRSRDTLYLPNVIVTVAAHQGRNEKAVIRYRENPFPNGSYVHAPYMQEGANEVYATGPLMKGYPLQLAASEALNIWLAMGLIQACPPISYDKDDSEFSASGGPEVFPRAQWATLGDIEVHNNIGDLNAMLAGYQELIKEYVAVTRITAPRLGAQAKSHTTATSADIEQTRGIAPLTDYVAAVKANAMTECLKKEWLAAKFALRTPELMYVDDLDGYVTVSADVLPDVVTWKVLGAAGPFAEAQEQQRRQGSLLTAAQLNTMAVQLGEQPMSINELQRRLLRDAGVKEPEALFAAPAGPGGGAGQPPAIEGPGGLGEGGPGLSGAFLEAVEGGRGPA